MSIGEKTSLMRTPWTPRDVDERTDRELTQVFGDAARALEPDARALRLAQAKVATNLARADAESGSLRRRLAFGTLGGGALWATALGTAAAHKAAAIAVVGGLLVGGVVAEQSGVGPAVRETIGIERAFEALTSQDGAASDADAGTDDATTAIAVASPNATLPAAATSVQTEAAPAGLPGQLHTTIQPGGDFTMRAVLQDYGADWVDLDVAGDAVGATVTLSLAADAVLQVPGKPGDASGTDQLASYVGRLVVVRGYCDGAVEDLPADAARCTISRLQILGGPAADGPALDGSSSGRGASGEHGQGAGNANANGGGPKPQNERQPSEPAEPPEETVPHETGPPEHSSVGGQGKNEPE